MAATHVNPTRMELTRLKKKLATAARGHKLLKDKRDELMRQFLDLVRENKALREKVEAGIAAANQNFVLARAGMSGRGAGCGADDAEAGGLLGVQMPRNVMSVDIPVFTYRDPDVRRKRHLFLWLCLYLRRSGRRGEVAWPDILPDMLRLAEV